MSSSQVILNALPSFWRDRFEDRDLLASMYSYLGTYLGDVYEEVNTHLSKLSLSSTPIFTYKTWSILPLSTVHRLTVNPAGDTGNSIVIYGLREQDYLLNSCYRLYASPDTGSPYIDTGNFSFYDRESREISDIIELTGNTAFFSRFSRFIVFTNLDPISELESQEPQAVRAFYPLAFRVNNYLLGDLTAEQIVANPVALTIADYTVTANILAVEKQSESTLLLVDPDAFTPFIDDATVSIAGLTPSTIQASVYTSYSLQAIDINLWAYDCEIDDLELFRRWGFLLRSDFVNRAPVRSSERYKNLLEEMLAARLRGLSSKRIENIAGLLAGSDRIVFSSLNDTLLTLDLVDSTILSKLTTYSVLPRRSINLDVVKACLAVQTEQGLYPRDSLVALEILEDSVFRLLVNKYNATGPHTVSVRINLTDTIGDIILTCTGNTIVLTNMGGVTIPAGSGLRIYYTQSNYISLQASKYAVTSLSVLGTVSSGEIINPEASVADISAQSVDVSRDAIFLPQNIWEVSEPARREVTTKLTPHIVGQMPNHRVGDYELYIPSDVPSVSIFDAVSTGNPLGYAWPTSYKLYTDFLVTKIAVLKPVNYPSSVDVCVQTVRTVRDASKRLLVSNEVPVIDYIPAPMDQLEVVVSSSDMQDGLVTHIYGGIGALGATLLLRGDIDITDPSAINRLGMLPPVTGGEYTFIPITVIGYGPGYALVDAGYRPELLLSLVESGYSVDLEIDSSYKRVTIDLATNYIGSDSTLMVVGASYPEYTSYFNFDSNTASEWLQVGVTPGAPPSSLSEDPIVVSASLGQPQVFIPVLQNLDDNIGSPSDNLPDPEEI